MDRKSAFTLKQEAQAALANLQSERPLTLFDQMFSMVATELGRKQEMLVEWHPSPGPQTDAYFSEADELLYGGQAGGGKGIGTNTCIPTPSGYTTMGDLQPGDTVLDECGDECKVTWVSDIHHRKCYRLRFWPMANVIADDVHKWKILIPSESPEWRVVETAELYRLHTKGKRQIYLPSDDGKGRIMLWQIFETDSEPTKCIAVDSPSHLFLITDRRIATHNSDLLIGLSLTAHYKSIIFRREYSQSMALVDRASALLNVPERGTYNTTANRFKLNDGRVLELGGLKDPGTEKKYQGREHDLLMFDELANILESQYLFLHTWLRSPREGQRCRIVCGSNPPTSAEGFWIIKRWGAWLDPQHPNPAKDGELRWYVRSGDGEDIEVPNSEPWTDPKTGRIQKPMSRSFIRSRLSDNPYLRDTNYATMLDSLPEPLRSLMRDGAFGAGFDDDPYQVIPTLWVDLAMNRWKPNEDHEHPMGCIAVDVTRGGEAKTVLARRHANWVGQLIKVKGSNTPDGKSVAALVQQYRRDSAAVNIDAAGVGTDAYERCKDLGVKPTAINFASPSSARDSSGALEFINLRAQAFWTLRELLDPNNPNPISLPPDQELKSDLCAPKWELRPHGILIESKESIAKRIGRSTDCGDAVAMAFLNFAINPVASDVRSTVNFEAKKVDTEVRTTTDGTILVLPPPSYSRRGW